MIGNFGRVKVCFGDCFFFDFWLYSNGNSSSDFGISKRICESLEGGFKI